MARVVVYKNLIRGDWSVAELKGSRGKGKVIAHCREVILADVTMHVSEASRQAVIAKRCRSVHAWCVGTIACSVESVHPAVPVTYNPYRAGTFTRRDNGQPVTAADYVHFTPSDGAVAYDVEEPWHRTARECDELERDIRY